MTKTEAEATLTGEADGEALSSVLERCSGSLLRVTRIRAQDPISGDDILSCENIEALTLQFLGVDLWIICEAATDEIRLSFAGPEWPTSTLVDMSDKAPWRNVIGLNLGFAWFLENDRGYRDGVQLEFFQPHQANHTHRIELEAAASKIRSFVVEPA